MSEFSREYLELLAEKYPDEAAVCSEIINLRAILALPMGTEHFISDLHGEYAAVRHILNNCSGVILGKGLAPFRGRDRGGALPKPVHAHLLSARKAQRDARRRRVYA